MEVSKDTATKLNLLSGVANPKRSHQEDSKLIKQIQDYYLRRLLSGETISRASYSLSLLMTAAQNPALDKFNAG